MAPLRSGQIRQPKSHDQWHGQESQVPGWIRLPMQCNTRSEVILLPQFGNR